MKRFLLILLVLAAAAAYLSKPSEPDVRAEAKALIRGAIDAGSLDDVADPAMGVLLLTCKSDPDACANLLAGGIELTYEDRILYARVDAEGFGRGATCYAAYTKLFCPDGLIR